MSIEQLTSLETAAEIWTYRLYKLREIAHKQGYHDLADMYLQRATAAANLKAMYDNDHNRTHLIAAISR
jgi:hypothetical protein